LIVVVDLCGDSGTLVDVHVDEQVDQDDCQKFDEINIPEPELQLVLNE
jgi:hypothetical protein